MCSLLRKVVATFVLANPGTVIDGMSYARYASPCAPVLACLRACVFVRSRLLEGARLRVTGCLPVHLSWRGEIWRRNRPSDLVCLLFSGAALLLASYITAAMGVSMQEYCDTFVGSDLFAADPIVIDGTSFHTRNFRLHLPRCSCKGVHACACPPVSLPLP
jgi:hypothetical protein